MLAQVLGFVSAVGALSFYPFHPCQLKRLPRYSTHLLFSSLHSWNCCYAVYSVVEYLYCCSDVLSLAGNSLEVMMEFVEGLDVHRKIVSDASHEHTVAVASTVRHMHSRFHHRVVEVPSKHLLMVRPETSSRNVLFRSTVKVR